MENRKTSPIGYGVYRYPLLKQMMGQQNVEDLKMDDGTELKLTLIKDI